MKNTKIDLLIAKFLSGESSPQERDELKLWLSSDRKHKKEFDKISFAYQLTKSKTSDSKSKSATLSKLKSKLAADAQKNLYSLPRSRNNRIKTWISIAASLVLFLSFGSVYYINNIHDELQKSQATANVIKSNPAGQKSKIFLPDGSIVWLNSESSISYESNFNDSTRLVTLKGEAFFEVMKDSKRPFLVESGNIQTTALGTAFNVNAFDMNNITVSLTQGKVNVRAILLDREMNIEPGSGVYFSSKNDLTFKKIAINPDKVSSWKDGLLELSNASLDETVKKLERWYGVKIIITNQPVREWNAEGVFDNEYLENVLDQLSYFQAFNYEKDGKNFYIKFKQEMPM